MSKEVAEAFIKKYAADGYARGKAADAKKYPRGNKTVNNMITRMGALFGKLMPKYARENPFANIKRKTVAKKAPVVPNEQDVSDFYTWFEKRFPGWELIKLFVEVKGLAVCRLNDLCQVKSYQFDPKAKTLTINPEDEKTHRERTIPLPDDIAVRLDAIKGPTYLWEQYTADAKKYRKGTRLKNEFTPFIFYNAVKSIFRSFKHAGGKLKTHGLRKRGITLTVLATQNVDQTAEAIGLNPATARQYYLDAKAAFNGPELMKKMADVLRPKT